MKIISIREAASELKIPEEMVVRSFSNLIKAGRVEGFYDEQDKSMVEYSHQDIDAIIRLVEERGQVSVGDVAKAMRVPTRIVELLLKYALGTSHDYRVDGNLLLKNYYVSQRLKEMISKNGGVGYDAASKMVGVSEKALRRVVDDFPEDFISLMNGRGVTTVERFATDIQMMSEEDPSLLLSTISKRTGIEMGKVQSLLEGLIEEKKLDGSLDYATRQYLRSLAPPAPKLEVLGGFEIIGELMKVGVKVANHGRSVAIDSSITLERVPEALSFAEPEVPYLRLGNIKPQEFQSAIYKLKPSRCVDGSITGVVNYHDHTGKRWTVEIPPIHIRNVCPFLTGEGVLVADIMDLLESGLLPSNSASFEFKGSPRLAFATAENRVRNLKLIERDEKTIDDGYCGYACYFGNAKYGGYYFATTIVVSGTERRGRITLTICSNDSTIVTGYVQEVMDDVRKHIETAEGVTVLTGRCPQCGGQLDPREADEKGLCRCHHCRCVNVIPPWMRV